MSTSQLPAAEQGIVAAVSGDTLMDYTGTIAQWVRLSGSEDEAKAFDYVAETCRGFGMKVERYGVEALVSWPGKATMQSTKSASMMFFRISPSFDWLDDIEPFARTKPASPVGARWWMKCCTQAKLALPAGGVP